MKKRATTPIEDLGDEDLVRQCQEEPEGITPAYEELVRRFEPVIYRTSCRMLGNPEDAREVTQDVLVRMFYKIGQFEGRSKFNTWLFRLAHHVIIRRREKIGRRRTREAQWAEAAREEMEQPRPAEGGSEGGLVFDILEQLEPADREIILLKFSSELEFREIAEVLDIGLSAAKMRYYRALEKFRELHRAGEEAGPTKE